MNMTLNDYQDISSETDEQNVDSYYYLGLAGEAGEVAQVRKRRYRGDSDPGDIVKELGDVLWYVAAIARLHNVSLETVAEENIRKLQSRKKAGTIRGSGDDR